MRGSVLQEGANKKSAARERRRVWRTFFYSRLRPKGIKVDKLKRTKSSGEGKKGLLLSLLCFTRLLPGYSWTVHLFRSFCLLLLSLETRGLDVVSLIFLTHYIIGAKTSGFFLRGSVFLSIPLLWNVCECVCVSWLGGKERVWLAACRYSGKSLFEEKMRF